MKASAFYVFLWTLLLPVCLLSAPAQLHPREVKVGYYDNYPKVFRDDNGQPAGIFIDILEYIAREESWTLRYNFGNWDECLSLLEKGELDLMLDVAYSTNRAEIFDFTTNDVIINWAQIYTRKGLTVRNFRDLEGMRIASLRQGIHSSNFHYLAKTFGIGYTMLPQNDYASVFKAIQNGQADAGIVNRVFGLMNQHRFSVQVSPIIFSPSSLHYTVKKGQNQDLLAALDRYLPGLKQHPSSVYHQSLKKWLGETSAFRIPEWIRLLILAALSGLAVTLLFVLLLRHQVAVKTRYLQQTNQQLEKQVQETMKLYRRLLEKEKEISRTQQNRAVLELSSGIVHDFNNQLTPIMGYADLLITHPGILQDQGKSLEIMRIIQDSASYCREILQRLKELQVQHNNHPLENLSMEALFAQVIESAVPAWQQDASARSHPVIRTEAEEGILITADILLVREALINLLTNALYATREGGDILLKAYTTPESTVLEITDTGSGMDTPTLEHCLDPFYTTKGSEGTGLGLHMVRDTMIRHGGEIQITSHPGKGTTVQLVFPAPGHLSGHEKTADMTSLPRELQVLIADPDHNAGFILQEFLRELGHHSKHLTAPEELLQELATGHWDLVISEYGLGPLSGIELVRKIRHLRPDIPILIVSGFAYLLDLRNELPSDVDYLLSKPFTLKEFAEALHCLGRTADLT